LEQEGIVDREHELSQEQAAVVEFNPRAGHLLVLARPGSGKTHTLAARASRLLADSVDPSQLLAMTFSNRAADQLKDRLPGGQIWAGTFHSVSADILEHHGAAIGVRWPFRIADDGRSREFLLRAVSEAGYPLAQDERARSRFMAEVKSRIERRKREGRDRDESRAGDHLNADVVAAIDEGYCRLLAEANTLDFADLIAKAIATLEQDEETAEILRHRLTHLLVDEVHDISPEQYRLITLLAPPRWRSQVFVVGDPDQSIYEWRGAHAQRMIARYRADYQPAEFTLSVNFRSRAPIVSAADTLMAEAGRTRASRPHRGGSVTPFWCELADHHAEAREVVATIAHAWNSGSFAGYGSFAVLFRTHAAGNLVEAELLKAGIPLNRVQQARFFDDRDVQESLRYLELAYGMHEDGFEPALNWPRVIVDEVTMVHLRRLAAHHQIRLADMANRIDDFAPDISPLTRAAIREFRDTIVSDLGPTMGLPIDEALDAFLTVLKRRRGPVAQTDREALRDTMDLLATSLTDHLSSLEAAISHGRPLSIRVRAGLDCAAAAVIVRHAAQAYLGLHVAEIAIDEAATDNAFVLTLGEEAPCDGDGCGLGPLHTRTVQFSIATRAWRLMQMLLMARENLDRGRFLLLDIETSARHPERAEVLEFGALEFVEGEARDAGKFGLVRPSSPAAIDPEATDTHGLRWRDVADAPLPHEALPPLLAWLQENVVVGHNVEDFDLPVLRQAARRAGLAFQPPATIDTRRMAERLWPDEAAYRLEDLARRIEPGAVQEHRARSDCLLTGRLFASLLEHARRDRELDVLPECLPLVAASIVASDYVVADDNALLTTLGARAISLGHGQRLWSEWASRGGMADASPVRSRILAFLNPSTDEDERWERLQSGWSTAVEAFCSGTSDRGIASFLRYAALAQPIDSLPRATPANGAADPRTLTAEERVALMTVHSAKGLEWPVVFIVGLEDDQFPLYRAVNEDQLAEERRTLYVGMTRAKDRLFLFAARQRDGRAKRRSRFVDPLIGRVITPVAGRQ
jgi:superfamily I DNA/RNA helicase/DNA polymerase III epsilon subunit-like protein